MSDKQNHFSMNNIQIESLSITIQIIASIISIGTILISIILLYNHQLEIEGKEPFFNSKQAQKLTTFNRSLALIIFIIFLIINIILYKISKEEGEELTAYTLQIIASILTVSAAVIALYVVLRERIGDELVNVENPIF